MMKIAAILLVVLVTGCHPSVPPTKIIHVANWHWLSKPNFAVDVRKDEPDLTDEQINELYPQFIADIEAFQDEQFATVRELVKQHNARFAFLEGMTLEQMNAFSQTNEKVKLFEEVEADIELMVHSPMQDEDTRQKSRDLIAMRRSQRAQLGTIGRLIRLGELQGVLPLEWTETLDAANPVTTDGKIRFDPAAVKAREEAMARHLMESGPVAIVILGGEHDLTDALKATGRPFTYERIETPMYTKLAK